MPGGVKFSTPANSNRDIMRQVRAWAYRPALRDGTPVDGWAEIVRG